MLNSSSNNPGIGNLDGLKAKLGAQNQVPGQQEETSEPIIKEVYEDEPDDYNYVPQLRDVDDAEIRSLSALQDDEKVNPQVYKACAAFLIAALIGAGIGFGVASSAETSADIQRKSSVARTIKTTVETKLTGLAALKKDFGNLAGGSYNDANFENFRAKVRSNAYPFMLDMSSDVSAEAVLLVDGKSSVNPLSALRQFSAKTMLLRTLLETHGAETHSESDAIIDLQSQKEGVKVTYAMQVIPDALYYLATDAPRGQYANGVVGIYTYHDFIEDDIKLAEVYSQIKEDNSWSEMQRHRRDYKPKRGEKSDVILPNRIIYETVDRHGTPKSLFADELILVDRSLFFGESANAKERYELRTQNIQKLIDEITTVSSSIVGDLESYIVE